MGRVEYQQRRGVEEGMQGSCFGATRGCNMRSKRGVWFDLSRVRGEIGLSVRCYSAS